MNLSRTNGTKRMDNLSDLPDPGRHFQNKLFVHELLWGPCYTRSRAVRSLLFSIGKDRKIALSATILPISGSNVRVWDGLQFPSEEWQLTLDEMV
ncbi:hypothetical protein AVEN_174829-1 [Araneus ventricosus]|uniref:Uncharacterized protein n=1 Tax=Araneus ventricosus TaxID=182803 RepID=A0A4Y2CQ41_ARAVE|nr:hypothetical protein AVEN_248904-1 [Araneus ventricosus]GBM05986.1 hypothetical protein AVEN_252738-1 [Araneus ventricosus]GBM06026.1 hypothetical protein AVEN_17387-1 [Araneus ventricosus]GBM06156.1 hypothetical protein AVEN_174829-1 [Araneus ventricosus]